MIQRLVHFFLNRHLLTNSLFVLVFIIGIFCYQTIKKEEFPDITFRSLSIQTTYPNASAEDVESDVTIPLEESIQSISGIRTINSTSSLSFSSISIELDRSADVQTVKTDVSNAIQSIPLPADILTEPKVVHFDISKKAILDIGIYFQDTPELTTTDRFKLQQIARQLHSYLVNNSAFSDVRLTGYLSEQLHIDVDPLKLDQFKIPIDFVANTLQDAHRQLPVGEAFNKRWTPVRIKQSLEPIDNLLSVKLNQSFGQGDAYLNDVATVSNNFERKSSITRVNGSEAIILELVKSSETDILSAIDIAKSELERFKSIYLDSSDIKLILLDDESTTLRNRLNIISTNGLIGFILILITLIIFLNRQSAFWVAIGLPFCVAFTLIMAKLFGLTINGITLSAIIIVLGIVVDDAIIIAEHIYRCYFEGLPIKEAAIKGVHEMLLPVLAGVTTTCMAFAPLLMFDNRFSDFFKPIPIVIFLMLGASLLESFFILPGHILLSPPKNRKTRQWFERLEIHYTRAIRYLVSRRWRVMLSFLGLMIVILFLGKSRIKFIMFPHDESREIVISGKVKDSNSLSQTANSLNALELTIPIILGDNNLGFTTQIARQRFGGKQTVNSFFVTIEIPEASDRNISANEMIDNLKSTLSEKNDYSDLTFRKARWGQQSGSAIEIKVQSNNDDDRLTVIKQLEESLKTIPEIESVEVKKAFIQPVIEIDINQNELQRLGVNTATIASSLKSAMGGIQLFDIQRQLDPINYKLRIKDFQTLPMNEILNLNITNSQGYLVPLSEMVSLVTSNKPHQINRRDGYRISTLYADLKANVDKTPLEIANELETNIFPQLIRDIPGIVLSFDGEIIDSRDGKKEFTMSFLIAILGIYFILTLLFQSVLKPLRILFILPFGVVSVMLVFLIIGKSSIGFFGLIGILGMLGVVINDAIVLYVRLDRYKIEDSDIATISSTRLRAILLTTITTVAGVMPTAYGIGGFDAMLSEMMLSLGWGLVGGMLVTLILVPTAYACERDISALFQKIRPSRWLLGIGLLIMLTQPVLSTELTDTKFIRKALSNNPSYLLILEQEIGQLHSIDLSVAVSDIISSILLGTSYNFDSEESIPDSSIGISKLFYPTGTNASLYYQNKRYAGSNFKIESYGATFAQDLIQNSFGKNNRLKLANTDLQKEIIKLQSVEAVEDYIASLHQIYYNWAEAYKRVQLERNILNNIQLLQKEVDLKYKRRVASNNDVKRIQLQELNQQGILIEAEKELKNEANQISLLINDSTSFSPVVRPLNFFNSESPTYNRSLYALKLTSQVTLNEESISINELFPSIALDTTIYNEKRTINNTSSESLFITSGLNIELPISNHSKDLSNKIAESNNRQSKFRLASAIKSYNDQTYRLNQTIRSISDQYALDMKKRKLSNDILTQDGEDYRRGSLPLNQYIESLNQSIQSQHLELSRLIQYHKAHIEWLRLTDQLLIYTGPIPTYSGY